MNKLILTTKQLEQISFCESERFIVTEQGAWESQGKFEIKEFVFQDTLTGQHYKAQVGRSGDYYSGYYYDSECDDVSEEVLPVEGQPVTRIEWVSVDNNLIKDTVDLTKETI